ncbi:MAG TPA: 5'/3'-nucleotidase SurE [Chloroflexota bacterium]|nr:5'/3'-nucleotidase SurE [Chloroflexota bacterium]
MILVTNDDGIDSEGLLRLKQALSDVDRVEVVAPNRNWTAAGHTKTMHRPLRIAEVTLADGSPAYSSDGSPSDCVALAFLGILDERPGLVFSGINKGPNLGSDLTYSGTLAAAMEGVVCGVPAVAVSLADSYQWDFSYAAEFSARLARHILENGLEKDVLLNVNVPHVPRPEVKGVVVTRLGKRIYRDELIRPRLLLDRRRAPGWRTRGGHGHRRSARELRLDHPDPDGPHQPHLDRADQRLESPAVLTSRESRVTSHEWSIRRP